LFPFQHPPEIVEVFGGLLILCRFWKTKLYEVLYAIKNAVFEQDLSMKTAIFARLAALAACKKRISYAIAGYIFERASSMKSAKFRAARCARRIRENAQ